MEVTMEDPAPAPAVTTTTTTLDETAIATFAATHPKLYILTPCYGGACMVTYVSCLLATVELFRKYGIRLQIEFCRNDSLVPRARNNLIARAMNDPEMTHMLFIDSDINWQPLDVLKLMMAGAPVVGGVYPLKRYHWQRLFHDPVNPYNTNIVQSLIQRKQNSQLHDMMTDEEMVRANLVSYNVNYLTNNLVIDNNLAEVRHVATGFMMIARTTIERMSEAYPETKYVDDVQFLNAEENAFAYALFDCQVKDGHYFSEDWMFCHRWNALGGKVFIHVTVNLTHSGVEDFSGCYLASILP